MAKTEAKPTADAYTGMLAISLLSLIIGCALLYLDYSQYPERPPQVPKAPAVIAPSADAPGGAPGGEAK